MVFFRPSIASVLLAIFVAGGAACHETPSAGDGTAVAREAPPSPFAPPSATPIPPVVVPPVRAPAAAGWRLAIAGEQVPVSTRVVRWDDRDGFDGYTPGPDGNDRFGQRVVADQALADEVAAKGWNRERLARRVDQFVLHFDGCFTSRQCAGVLAERGLSVHFLLDVDGTVYQALDLSVRAWHATIANDRSIGIEIANPGAVARADAKETLARFYRPAADGWPALGPPDGPDQAWPAGFVPRPARRDLVLGPIQGEDLAQYDFTPQQYEALARLLAALHRALPRIRLDAPRNADGSVKTAQLTPSEFAQFHGVLGHYHVQGNKVDPGPAMRWDWLFKRAKEVAAEEKAAPKEGVKGEAKSAEVAPVPVAAPDGDSNG